MCRKVVEYGLLCESCSCWFHATEQCCGDALATAFTVEGRDSWNCLNCFPRQGVAQPPDPLKKIAAQIDHDNWRRAFRILTDSCAGCGLTVRERSAALRCATCSLAFHANGRCTGYDDEELSSRLARCAAAANPANATLALKAFRAAQSTVAAFEAAESVSSDDEPVAAAAAATAAAAASSGPCTGGPAATDASTRDADSDGDGGASTTSSGGVGSSSSNNGVVGGSGGSSGGGNGSSSSIGGDNGSSRDVAGGSSSGGGGGIGNGSSSGGSSGGGGNGNVNGSSSSSNGVAGSSRSSGGVCDGGTSELPPWHCPTCLVQMTGSAVENSLVSDDVSCGQEANPIPLLNEVDDETQVQLSNAGSFEYAKLCVWRHPRAIEQRDKLPLADWGGRCIHHEATSWLPGTDASGSKPVPREGGGGSAYNADGQLLFARDCIFECNSTCSCPPECPNRVVGRGVALPLQVVKTVGRGWGVRCRQKILAGTFICEYTGNMLLDSDAEAAGLQADDSYLFNLDGEQKGQVKKRQRTGSATNVSASAQTANNPDLAADASRIGSVARFLNHCCEPNLFVQSVFIEYSRRVHRIGIFAARDILPYEELTYDYGYVVGSVEGKSLRCLCGAPSCRGYLF